MSSSEIARLNDEFRRSLGAGGRLVHTQGIASLGPDFLLAALGKIAAFEEFDETNDPHGEHDFGAFRLGGEKLFWKIDCYDKRLKLASPDPADPSVTIRVLTLMLAHEY